MPIAESVQKEILKEAYADWRFVLPQEQSKWIIATTWDYLDQLNLPGKIELTFQDRITVRRLCVANLKNFAEYEDYRQKVGFLPAWLLGIIINILVKIILDWWLKSNERIG